jgi:hypothetical protein
MELSVLRAKWNAEEIMASVGGHDGGTVAKIDASRAGTFSLGGDLNVYRLGFGTIGTEA